MAEALGEQSKPRDMSQVEKRRRLAYDPEEFTLRKRLPRTFTKRDIDIYVSKKTNFLLQLERCKKLLNGGEDEVVIHGLGAAVNRAINLSLQLKAVFGDVVEITSQTSTEEMIDDLEPVVDTVEPKSQSRSISAIHIRVTVAAGKRLVLEAEEQAAAEQQASEEDVGIPQKRQRLSIGSNEHDGQQEVTISHPAVIRHHYTLDPTHHQHESDARQFQNIVQEAVSQSEARHFQAIEAAAAAAAQQAETRHFQTIQIITDGEASQYHQIQRGTLQPISFSAVSLTNKQLEEEQHDQQTVSESALSEHNSADQEVKEEDAEEPVPEVRVRLTYDTEEHSLRKSLPKKFPRRDIDIYVTPKTNFKIQFDRCQKLISFYPEINIRGFGPGINRAIYLSLQLKALYGDVVDVSSYTTTEDMSEFWEAAGVPAPPQAPAATAGETTPTQTQSLPASNNNDSAIHIRVFKKGTPADAASQ